MIKHRNYVTDTKRPAATEFAVVSSASTSDESAVKRWTSSNPHKNLLTTRIHFGNQCMDAISGGELAHWKGVQTAHRRTRTHRQLVCTTTSTSQTTSQRNPSANSDEVAMRQRAATRLSSAASAEKPARRVANKPAGTYAFVESVHDL